MNVTLAEAINSGKILILDGAMGTQLAARGAVQGPVSNLDYPDHVKAVHADYISAGADVILTNTLTANRIFLEHAGMADRFAEINLRGVEIARKAANGACYVLGDMTSTGSFMEPLGEYTEEQFLECFAEQAALLAENGVDGIIIETMTDVREASVALRAAREATRLPVLVTISFDPAAGGFRTMMGDTIERAVEELSDADAIGCNCGTLDPIEASAVIGRMRELTQGLLVAEPNAGKPELSAGQVSFRLSPEDFAEGAKKCLEAGATLVGGCCGTTPAHIAALAARVKG